LTTTGLALHPECASASRVTNVSGAADSLRRVLACASGGAPGHYVVQRQQLFHLAMGDAADVDLWRVHEHLFRAASALDEPTKIKELRLTCAEYKGALADGTEYAWIAPYRDRVRRMIADAQDTLAALAPEAHTAITRGKARDVPDTLIDAHSGRPRLR
jgi:hypothetical protein